MQSRRLEPGDRMRVVEALEAIFDATLAGRDRVQVLLSYLSGQAEGLIIGTEYVEKIDED